MIILIIILIPVFLWAANLYVTPNPSTGADCSQTNPCGLQDALDIAGTNGEPDTLFLEGGTYTLTSTLTYIPSSTENFSISVEASDPNNKPVIDGAGSSKIMKIDTTGLSDDSAVVINIKNIVFYNGLSSGSSVSVVEIRTNSASVNILNCEFRNNTFDAINRVLFVKANRAELKNNIFADNTYTGPRQSYLIEFVGSYVSFINNLIENNTSSDGPVISIYASSQIANIIGNIIRNNYRYTGINLINSISFVYNNVIEGNRGVGELVGGCIGFQGTYSYIYSNYCANNDSGGGSIYILNSNAEIVNNIIHGNSVSLGGGGIAIDVYQGNVIVTNNTIYGNRAAMGGGIWVYFYSSWSDRKASVSVYNNIIYNNRADMGAEIFVVSEPSAEGTLNVYYNLVSSRDGIYFELFGEDISIAMDENIFGNPLFVDPSTGNFGLQADSPAIDAGFNGAPALPLEDYTGKPRIIGDAVDIGAVEYDPSSPPSYPNIKLDMDEVNFGDVLKYERKYTDISVVNVGSEPLNVSDVYVTGNGFSVDVSGGNKPCGSNAFILPAGDNCTLRIYFEGSEKGTYEGMLFVLSNDPDSPELTLYMRANVIRWSDTGEVNTNYGKVVFYTTEGKFEVLKAENMSCKLPEGYKLSKYGSVRLVIDLGGKSDTWLEINVPDDKKGIFLFICSNGKGSFLENATVSGSGVGISIGDNVDGKEDGRIDVYIAIGERGIIQEIIKKKGCSFSGNLPLFLLFVVLLHYIRFRYNLFR